MFDVERSLSWWQSCICGICFVKRQGVRSRTNARRLEHGGQHGDGTTHPDCQQAAGCVHPARGAYATGPAADRRSGWAVCRKKLCAWELRRQVYYPIQVPTVFGPTSQGRSISLSLWERDDDRLPILHEWLTILAEVIDVDPQFL